MLGGVCVNTGTIPSKTLREAVVYLTGMNQRELACATFAEITKQYPDASGAIRAKVAAEQKAASCKAG